MAKEQINVRIESKFLEYKKLGFDNKTELITEALKQYHESLENNFTEDIREIIDSIMTKVITPVQYLQEMMNEDVENSDLALLRKYDQLHGLSILAMELLAATDLMIEDEENYTMQPEEMCDIGETPRKIYKHVVSDEAEAIKDLIEQDSLRDNLLK